MLAVPRALKETTGQIANIHLQNYFDEPAFDIVVNNNLIPNYPAETREFPDCGYLTGKFAPTFTTKNLALMGSDVGYPTFVVPQGEPMPSAQAVEIWVDQNSTRIPTGQYTFLYGFAYGIIPKTPGNFYDGQYLNNTIMTGSIASIPAFTIKMGKNSIRINQVSVYPQGIIFIGVDQTVKKLGNIKIKDGRQFTFVQLQNDNTAINHTLTIGRISSPPLHKIRFFSNKDNTWGGIPYTEGKGGWQTIDTDMLCMTEKDGTCQRITWADTRPPVYQFTYNYTGNNNTTGAVPDGLSQVYFMRPGTTLNKAMPVNGIKVGGSLRLEQILTDEQNRRNAEWLEVSFGTNSIDTEFTLAFRNGIWMIKSALMNKIRIGVLTRNAVLTNIQPAGSAAQIKPANISSWDSWISGSYSSYSRLEGMQRQAAIAAILGGQAIGGAAQAGASIWQTNQVMNNLQLNRELYLKMQQLDLQHRRDMLKQQFEQQLALKGLTSTSAESGNVPQISNTAGLGIQRFVPGGILTNTGTNPATNNTEGSGMQNPGRMIPTGGKDLLRGRDNLDKWSDTLSQSDTRSLSSRSSHWSSSSTPDTQSLTSQFTDDNVSVPNLDTALERELEKDLSPQEHPIEAHNFYALDNYNQSKKPTKTTNTLNPDAKEFVPRSMGQSTRQQHYTHVLDSLALENKDSSLNPRATAYVLEQGKTFKNKELTTKHNSFIPTMTFNNQGQRNYVAEGAIPRTKQVQESI